MFQERCQVSRYDLQIHPGVDRAVISGDFFDPEIGKNLPPPHARIVAEKLGPRFCFE
jgi:hypothetical protein